MADRRAYERKLTALSAWTVKAIFLIVAGAATVILALTITRNVSFKSDPAPGGRVVGVRHDAVAIPSTREIQPGVPSSHLATASPSYGGQEKEDGTVVRNGITVVSPELLKPVIDIDSLQAADGSDDEASPSKSSDARKRSLYAKRSQSQPQSRTAAKRKTAYGVAIR